jgi:hypothetical protein
LPGCGRHRRCEPHCACHKPSHRNLCD